ncbi:MAG: ACT domain-containing protein [Thermodesulfobacteriota bacterium]
MKAYQITIPAENKPGVLAGVTSILAKEKINIRAISITSFGQSGYFHMIVDDPERGHRALTRGGTAAELNEIVAVLIPDKPGGLDKLIQILAAGHMNIENAYGFVIESHKHAVFVIDVKNPDEVEAFLKKAGYQILSSQALSEIEPFHYMKY